MRPIHIGITVVVLGFLSCSGGDRGGQPVSEETVVRLYAAVLAAQEESGLRGEDSSARTERLDSLFRRHRVTREQLHRAIARYENDLHLWKDFSGKVINQLETMQRQGFLKLNAEPFGR